MDEMYVLASQSDTVIDNISSRGENTWTDLSYNTGGTGTTYSHSISNEMKKVTNQKASGRCWGFAGLNLMRIAVCKKYNLANFEFSQNYFMFCDKLEKSNYFLENIIS